MEESFHKSPGGIAALLLPLLLLWSASAISFDAPAGSRSYKQQIRTLADDQTWLRLLHLRPGPGATLRTDITSTDFYISGAIPPDPEQELTATIDAFRQATTTPGEEHPQCRYPARLHWLRTKLPALFHSLPKQRCKRLKEWIVTEENRNIYLVHVSGYFGNPASAFGHILLRIGNEKSRTSRGLLDLGINFGARIPAGENPVSYIFKGIFGGYTATFSDKRHYLQDQIYSGSESRDMWAYELNLSEYQKRLLMYHLWELVDVEFRYYFLRQNCAYRIAELMELILNRKLIPDSRPYYLPVDLFYTLSDIDTESGANVIDGITFIPSRRRETLAEFGKLDPADAKLANQVITAGKMSDLEHPPSVELLDFLLDYLDYRSYDSTPEELPRLVKLKQSVLKQRFRHAPRQSMGEATVSPLAAPGSGIRARAVRLSVTSENEGGNVIQLGIAPYAFDILDDNRGSLKDSSFKVLELRIRSSAQRIRFHSLDILSIEKLAAEKTGLAAESGLAWRGGVKILENRQICHGCIQGKVAAGAGQSVMIDRGFLYGMLDLDITTLNAPSVTISLSAGGVWRPAGNLSSRWESRYDMASTRSLLHPWQHRVSIRYRIDRDNSLELAWQQRFGLQSTMLEYTHRW